MAASPETKWQWARTRPSRASPLPVPQREHITWVSPSPASALASTARRGCSFPRLKLLQAQRTGWGSLPPHASPGKGLKELAPISPLPNPWLPGGWSTHPSPGPRLELGGLPGSADTQNALRAATTSPVPRKRARLRGCRGLAESVMRGGPGLCTSRSPCTNERKTQVSLPQLPVTNLLFFVNFKR